MIDNPLNLKFVSLLPWCPFLFVSEAEVTDIIHWFQSLWPDRVYATWVNINAAAQ